MNYQADNMETKMLKLIRVKMGLGDPPREFINNPKESTNARIKEKVDYQRSELHVFCTKMKELVDKQTRNIERAFTMDTGSYMVWGRYSCNKQNPKMWTKQSTKYKERIIREIHNIPLVPPVLQPTPLQNSSDHNATSTISQLSVSLKERGLSEELFSGMWQLN